MFLKGELQNMSVDLKDLKQEFRTLNFRLSKIVGKLESLEKNYWETQSEIRNIKQKVDTNEERERSLEKMIRTQEQSFKM